MLIGQLGELRNTNERDFIMTNFTKTLIAGLILSLGAARSAHAADDTFKVILKQDTSVSVEDNYLGLKKQARIACERELKRAGFQRKEMSNWLRAQCEKPILEDAVKAMNDPYLTLVHNDSWGEPVKVKAYAQK